MRVFALALIIGSFLIGRSCNSKPVIQTAPKPVTYEFRDGPGSGWKITDPRFADWISEHCYVVEKAKFASRPDILYSIKCKSSSKNEVEE